MSIYYNNGTGNRYVYAGGPGASSQFTVAGWVRRVSSSGSECDFFGRSSSNDWQIGKDGSDHLYFTQANTPRLTGTTVIALATGSTDRWYFVAYTRDGSSNHTLWLGTDTNNGNQSVAAEAGPTNGSWDPQGTECLAFCRNDWSGIPWAGYMDYFRVWSVALSQAELEAERATTSYARAANLFGNWQMLDSTGVATQLTDTSGNSRHAAVTGTAWVDSAYLNFPVNPALPAVGPITRVPSVGAETYTGIASSLGTTITPAVARERHFERERSGLLVPSRRFFLPAFA